nr:hypothetical protein [Acidovorax sp. CCYZU-2555]
MPPRLVVFVGGFDPRGARHYYRLFAEHAVLQGKVDGREYAVGPRRPLDVGSHRHAQWTFSGEAGGGDYVFFDWSDAVRAHWPRSWWRVTAQACKTYATVLKDWRVLRPIRRQTPNTLLAFAYPLLYICLAVMLAMGGFALGWRWSEALPSWVRWMPPSAIFAAALWGSAALDKRLNVSWLLRIFNFAAHSAQRDGAVLAQRTLAMADWIQARSERQPGLEVVVVGFSVGSVQALHLVDALRQRLPTQPTAVGQAPAAVTLLTLGNCIPLFTLMRQAQALRATLQAVAADSRVFWADVSSPGDSVSFGMCDLLPLAMRGAPAPAQAYANPRHMCSPRFHKLFEPQTYRRMRRNKMRMHFQYLMASEKQGAYNFFAMLAAPGAVRTFVEKYLVR